MIMYEQLGGPTYTDKIKDIKSGHNNDRLVNDIDLILAKPPLAVKLDSC